MRWLMLFGVWILYFCFGLTAYSLAPLVRPITQELNMNYAEMGRVLGSWQLIYIFTALPCGSFIDRVGLRTSLLISAVLIGLSCLTRGFAQGPFTLLIAVASFGLGGPLISIGAPKLISIWFKGRERGLAMGLYITGLTAGVVTALSITNSVVMPWVDGEWREVLKIYSYLVFLSGLIWIFISANQESREMEESLRNIERPPQIQVFRELFNLAPVRILLLLGIGIFIYNHALSNWLHEILMTHGVDSVRAGYLASVPTLIGIAGVLLIPRLAVSDIRIQILSVLFIFAGTAVLLLKSSSIPIILTGLILKGITQGSMMAIIFLIMMEIPQVGARYTGSAGGMFFAAAEVGGVLGPLSLGLLYDTEKNFQSGLNMLSMVCLMLLVLAFILKLMLKRELTQNKFSSKS
jgi:cyanate permease